MAKNIPKEELEADILVTGYAKLYGFMQDHMWKVIVGFIALIVVIGAGIAFYLIGEQRELESQEALVFAERYFEQGEYDYALFGNEDAGHVGFVTIANEYSRTSAGNIASYYAAVSHVRLSNYEEALFYIERFNPPSGILGVGPIAFHASVLGSLGQYSESAAMFEKAAYWDENVSTTPQNLLNAAQTAFEAGEYNKARTHVDKIVNDYPQSAAAQTARTLKGMLAARS